MLDDPKIVSVFQQCQGSNLHTFLVTRNICTELFFYSMFLWLGVFVVGVCSVLGVLEGG